MKRAKFNSLILDSSFHFSSGFIKIHWYSTCSQEALTQSLRESNSDKQGQDYLKTRKHPEEKCWQSCSVFNCAVSLAPIIVSLGCQLISDCVSDPCSFSPKVNGVVLIFFSKKKCRKQSHSLPPAYKSCTCVSAKSLCSLKYHLMPCEPLKTIKQEDTLADIYLPEATFNGHLRFQMPELHKKMCNFCENFLSTSFVLFFSVLVDRKK